MASILIHSLKSIAIGHSTKVAGALMKGLPSLEEGGYILIEDDRIAAVGPDSEAPARADRLIDGRGRMALPAWVDSHTHLVFAGSRQQEFVDRIKGLSYEEIASRGGGILNSAARLREMDESELYDRSLERLQEVRQFGTGAIEIKSGYGLSLDSELKNTTGDPPPERNQPHADTGYLPWSTFRTEGVQAGPGGIHSASN